MTRTSPATLVLLVVVAALGGYAVQVALAATGAARLRAEYTVSVSLVLIAALVLALAVPIWRATHAEPRRRVDPFRATRTVVLAKASGYLGAAIGGFSIGLLVDLLTRPVAADRDVVVRVVVLLGSSAILLIAGLVAEHLCRVPPDDDDGAAASEAG